MIKKGEYYIWGDIFHLKVIKVTSRKIVFLVVKIEGRDTMLNVGKTVSFSKGTFIEHERFLTKVHPLKAKLLYEDDI